MMTGSNHRPLGALGLALIALASVVACRPAESAAQSTGSAGQPAQPATDNNSAEVAAGTPQIVSFPTSDGGLIYADLYGKGDHGVVLAHGARFTKESWKSQAPVLAGAGLRVLAIDFRGRGKSRGGPQAKRGERRHYLDVLGAVRYLRQNGAKTVSVVGASFGGGMAARAAVEAKPNEIDRLVLLSPVAIERPEKIKGRKLFIASRDDRVTRLSDIRDQYDRAERPKQLVVLEGSAHAQHIFGTKQGSRLMQEIQRFLSGP